MRVWITFFVKVLIMALLRMIFETKRNLESVFKMVRDKDWFYVPSFFDWVEIGSVINTNSLKVYITSSFCYEVGSRRGNFQFTK